MQYYTSQKKKGHAYMVTIMIGISGRRKILTKERSVIIQKQENPERPKIIWNYGPPLWPAF
jgi:hypothetical protein